MEAATCSMVIKRDGRPAAFDANKIRSAIARAGAATGELGDEAAARLTAQVVRVLSHKRPGGTPSIEEIQDLVVKSSWKDHARVTGVEGSERRAKASLQAILRSGVACEFHTVGSRRFDLD